MPSGMSIAPLACSCPTDSPSRLVRDAMLPLSEELIVSADMAIAELIPRMKSLPCRLILRGDRIDGLVTQSDLLKLPVRIVVFGLLTHLETVMADLIVTHWPGDEWLTALSAGRRAKLLEKETALRLRGLNPPRIELTEFADKRDLCKRLLAAGRTRFDRRWTGAQSPRSAGPRRDVCRRCRRFDGDWTLR